MNSSSDEFINILHDAMGDYGVRQFEYKAFGKNVRYLRKVMILFNAIWDFILLLSLTKKIVNKQLSIYFTHSTFVKYENNQFTDILFGELLRSDNLIFINYAKFDYLKKINGVRVYNLGIIVKILSRLRVVKRTTKQNNYNEWRFVNNFLTKNLTGNDIYVPAYSNEPGFSLVFSRYRKNFVLIEIQHGNVINYPPYSYVADRYLVDVFYCRDHRSKSFLENNLFYLFKPKLLVLNKKKVDFLTKTNRIEILYISSYEFIGFHPVFEDFLFTSPSNCHFKIRLHPRQEHLEDFYIESINKSCVSYEMDKSKYWFEDIPLNTVVISPFSSVVEEAFNLGIKSIIIDPVGAKRYEYLIDNKLCFFSENIVELILNLKK